jgi:hypothetical protein
MAHYQITVSSNGTCLERLVEDNYDANGNVITTVLGDWQRCKMRHVGIGGRTSGSGKPEMMMPQKKMLRSEQEEESERVNLLMIGVIVLFVGIILYKLR